LTQDSRPTVLLVDDHPVWRNGLRAILEPAFEVIAEAGEGSEAVQKALLHRPKVVLMDICMPGMDGIAATREIKEALPDTGVLMISLADDDEHIHESIRAGANGYVIKDDSPEAMCKAVQYAAQGEAYLPPLIAKRVLQGLRSVNGAMGAATNGPALSNREVTVLRLLVGGLRHKEIARELGISTRTVGNHVASIYNKLGIDDRAQAVIYAIKKGIVRV
jgi:DNA-binding NarL/FixJ family response regulator